MSHSSLRQKSDRSLTGLKSTCPQQGYFPFCKLRGRFYFWFILDFWQHVESCGCRTEVAISFLIFKASSCPLNPLILQISLPFSSVSSLRHGGITNGEPTLRSAQGWRSGAHRSEAAGERSSRAPLLSCLWASPLPRLGLKLLAGGAHCHPVWPINTRRLLSRQLRS